MKRTDQEVLEHLTQRVPVLKDTKKNILKGVNFEEIMKQADIEYQPGSLREKDLSAVGTRHLVEDEINGYRGSRLAPIATEDDAWRSDLSEPTLMVKIQTALSILIDQNPEATFKAVMDKYKPTTAIAKAIWKRSWSIAKSKEHLRLFIFDLAKYGWAIGRTYPRIVEYKGSVLKKLDVDNPENNEYEETTIVDFNDIYREKLDPYRTWIDDMANLTDPWSMDDWYFEKDYSKLAFEREFGMYEKADEMMFSNTISDDTEDGNNAETTNRGDIITLGFYESRGKDLYAIYCPTNGKILYHSPLPNDEKKLSCWWTIWNIRDPRTPYGIGLYEIIRGDKTMYDRIMNMTLDQLVLSIYSMLFYSGTKKLMGDGDIVVSPGLIKQKLPGTTIDQIRFDFNGKSFDGIKMTKEMIDETSGITPTLQGQVEGKTLGEVLHAKDSALKRLNIPLTNIATVIEKEAELTLSWANQVYSLPEIKEFVDEEELNAYIEEIGYAPENVYSTGGNKLKADFGKQLDLSLMEDREGGLIESPEDRFLVVGKDIKKKQLSWKGMITVNSQSIVSPSQELERQRKLELFNLVMPVIQGIATSMAQGMVKVALAMSKPVIQILEIQNEKPENWLPEDLVEMIENPELADQMEQQQQAEAQAAAQPPEEPLFVDQNAPQGAETPQNGPMPQQGRNINLMGQNPSDMGQSVVPRGEVSNATRESVQSTTGAPQTMKG